MKKNTLLYVINFLFALVVGTGSSLIGTMGWHIGG